MERSLPSASYQTDAAWQAERAAIFAREWFCAARAEDLAEPGSHALVEVTGESILIVAGDAIPFGHRLGGFRHGVNAVRRLQSRVDEAPAHGGVFQPHRTGESAGMRRRFPRAACNSLLHFSHSRASNPAVPTLACLSGRR